MLTGNAFVDSTFLVITNEPAMAQLLGQILPDFQVFRDSGVHLVGDGKSVSFMMERDKAPGLASSLYYAEAMARLLSELARRIGG